MMSVQAAPRARWERVALAATAVAIALTRFVSLAKGPWDWDEVLFCFGVGSYDVHLHHPHPPGFPLYILLGKIVRLVADSDFHALQTINVVASMLAFPVMYLAARAFRCDFLTSLWAAILFAFLPNVWFYGGTAFSDLPAAILFLGAIAAFLFSAQDGNARTYLAACALVAAGALVRPQNVPVVLFPWAIATWRFRRTQRRVVDAGAALAVGLTLGGYALAAWATGFRSYFDALGNHAFYVQAVDSVTAAAHPRLIDVLGRMLDPFQGGKVMIVLNALALAGIVAGIAQRRSEPLRAIALTFGPFFVFACAAVNPLGSSRFSLNWIAGVVLLAALGVSALARYAPRFRAAVFALSLAVLLGRLIPWTLPAFEQPRTTDAPPVAAVKWIAGNVPRTSVVYVDESIWPWAEYFDRGHDQVRRFDARSVVEDPSGVYVTMRPAIAGEQRVFSWPRNRTWNLVTQRAFEAYVIPARALAAFDLGWRRIEEDGHVSWQCANRGSIRFAPLRGEAELHLVFDAPERTSVQLKLNGKPLATYAAAAGRNELRYVVTPRADGVNVLAVELGDTSTRSRAITLRSVIWSPLRSS